MREALATVACVHGRSLVGQRCARGHVVALSQLDAWQCSCGKDCTHGNGQNARAPYTHVQHCIVAGA